MHVHQDSLQIPRQVPPQVPLPQAHEGAQAQVCIKNKMTFR